MGTRTRNFANNILSGGTIDGTDFLSGAIAAPNIANSSAVNVDSIPSITNIISPVAGDPPSPTTGDIWYNSVVKKLRYRGFDAAVWASGGNLSTARSDLQGNVGTQTSTLVGGGYTTGPQGTTATEEYDGSSWTAGGGRASDAFRVTNLGTQTAALGMGGYKPSPSPYAPQRYHSIAEEYNGSSWTAGGTLPQGIQGAAGTGTQTAGLILGGIYGPYTSASTTAQSNEYDGSSWTTGGSVPSARDYPVIIGTQTAAISTGGRTPSNTNESFTYNGTSFSSATAYPLSLHNPFGFGIQTDAVVGGGSADSPPGRQTTCNTWNGTSWTTTTSISTARTGGIGGGTSSSGVISSGSAPGGVSNATEEYTGEAAATKDFSND